MQTFREWKCRVFVVGVVLVAHMVHSNDVAEWAPFDACIVYTVIDYFTDEEHHRIRCDTNEWWGKNWIGVDCAQRDWWVTYLAVGDHIFHRGDKIRVKYRFDRLAVKHDDWMWSDDGHAYTFMPSIAMAFLQGVETARRLVFQIDDERGRVEFADSDAYAVDEFTQRCAESFGQSDMETWADQAPAVSRELAAALKPTAPAQPVPAPVIANREPPPPAVSREQAAAAAQALARAALKPLAPTPDAGEAPTNFGTPVAVPADSAPAPVSSESQRPSVGGPAATYDEAATERRMAGIDKTLAGSPSGGSAPDDGYLADGTERGSALGGGSSGVVWDDGNGDGCGEPLVDPKVDVSGISGISGISGRGVTYNIEVQFKLDGNGLVTGVNIVKSGNSELNSAVLSAARGMRFDCEAEARGRRTYEIKPGGR